ncbi:MAG TPA: prolyl oligopeptidase family serine peptidase [Gaiellaceae bacterium]|nr:prolyl oligopeptidase family serine peptidase [Gaiellaceae bacterium]
MTRLRSFARTEHGLVVLALAVVGVHIADDNFLQPAPGTSWADHLASGLVPLAILAAVGALYPRLRAGLRATIAVTAGAIGASTGVPGAYHLADGSASGDHFTGLAALAAGVALLLTGPVLLWKSRRTGGSRRRRYLLRARSVATAAVATPLLALFLVFPVAFSYGYTHIGRTTSSVEVGIAHEPVTITTSDGIDLAAAYVLSKNGAAVVVFPGAAAVKEARMIARNGYGVLLLDPRGQGGSEGDNVRWAGDRDLIAAAEYLQARPDVDPQRVAGFGSSVGGEILLEAAAQSDAFAAVVSEGAGWRIGWADLTGVERVLYAPTGAMLSAATTVFSNHGPPPPIADRIGEISPRPVFLIYADPGMGGESESQADFFAAAGEPKQLWKVPGSAHTGGIEAQPAEFERRVIGFLDRALLDR